MDEGSRWLNKVRARFHYNETKYWLTVTDPIIEKEYIVKEIGEYPVSPKGAAYLTVSITEPYEGFCYKLIAVITSGS